ncbi:patatin-like phospholipase family protein [Aurantiacibacter flavus]|uniref:Patatin-like phospholipase family protein n=1 Tax=Aurantiacibacter flavus TaxID=3145232 RepID=A0ABV0CXA9_9SPHN
MARRNTTMIVAYASHAWLRQRIALLLLVPLLLLGGCASLDREPFTATQLEAAQLPEMPQVRYWADAPDLIEQMAIPAPPEGEPRRLLALSGGGDKGAYGAGFLNGWSQSGERPQFSIVTGVSTGALIAPFALLGPDYDDKLTAAYTQITPDDIYEPRFPLAIPFSSSAATTGPLEELIARFATNALIDAVAEQHRLGRRLYVGTVNLDRPGNAIWDMGAIAASQAPDRYDLFRRIMLASSSVPVAFPPVLIETQIEGRVISELHVDGSTIATLLATPSIADGQTGRAGPQAELYLLVNGKMAGDFEMINGSLPDIAARTIDVILFASLQDRVNSAYVWSQAVGATFRLTYIGQDYDERDHDLFDQDFMRELYAYGLERGRQVAWQDRPPSPAPEPEAGTEAADAD